MSKRLLRLKEKLSKFSKQEDGFSLVEIAIGLVIIGLLVGAVFKGMDLIESARLNALITQIKDYRLATVTFYEHYRALPGDYVQATSLDATLKNGDGSGVITGDGLDCDAQACQFWSHLAKARLISQPGTLPAEGSATFGKGVPSTKMGGGVTVVHAPSEDMPGHWFCVGDATGKKNTKGLFTPAQAKALKSKVEDGDPTTGSVRIKGGTNASAKCLNDNGTYNLKTNEKVCIAYFQLF